MTIYVASGGSTAVSGDVLVADALEGVPVTGYGTSIMNGWVGASYPGSRVPPSAKYLERFARRIGTPITRTASTIPTEGTLNAGRVGNTTSYMAKQIMDTNFGSDIAWKTTDTGLVVFDSAANDAGAFYTTDYETQRAGAFGRIMRTLVLYIQLGARYADTDGSVTYNGTWTAQTGANGRGFNSSTLHQTTTLNSYLEVACTGPSVDLFIGGMDPAPEFATPILGGNVEVKVDGAVNQTVDTTELCKAADADTAYGQHCISLRGLGSGSHTIRLTNKTSGGNLIFGCWGYPSANPVGTVLIGVNDRADGAGLQPGWPAHLATFNGLLEDIADDLDRVVYVDPNVSPYTVPTHTIDDLHLSSAGHGHYTDLIEAAARTAFGDSYVAGIHFQR